jgi:hypothetical protein
MITCAEIEKLGAVHTVEPEVLSLYLTVPPHLAERRGLPAHAQALISVAGAAAARAVGERDRSSVLDKLAAGSGDWPGHSVAVFACEQVGLLESFPLACAVPERAVLGTRPHIRPLLAARQRCPACRVAVVDGRHAWVFRVEGDIIETVSGPLDHHGYRDTAKLLEQDMRHGAREPLVIGGHGDGIRRLLAALPPTVRASFAGSFAADTHALTPHLVRDLAVPVIARWADRAAQRTADEILALPPGDLGVVGLPACLAAVSAGPLEVLIVPGEGLVAGYECGRCGALSLTADSCPDWGTAPLPVPDVVEEMVARTLEDGGQVLVSRGAPAAARLRS